MNEKISLSPEYLSYVRHELRTQLTVIREGISQVLDGMAKKADNPNYVQLLGMSLECTDELNKLLDDLIGAGMEEKIKKYGKKNGVSDGV